MSAIILGFIGAFVGGFVVKLAYGRFKKSLSEFFFTTQVEHIEKEIFADTILNLAPPDPQNITSVADPPKRALETLYKEAAADKKQEKLHEWFEQWSKNSSVRFRRKQSSFAFFIGLILALAINADTLQIARALFENADLQTEIRAAADTYLKETNPDGAAEATETPAPETTPAVEATETVEMQSASVFAQAQNVAFAAAQGEEESEDDQSGDNDSESVDAVTGLLQSTEQLLTAGLPVGWEYSPAPLAQLGGCASELGQAARECDNTRNLWLFWEGNSPNYGSLIFRKIIGILLTAIAIAQGSPFWFDLLNKLVGRSSSGSEGAAK